MEVNDRVPGRWEARGFVLAPYGRDAELLAETVRACGASAVVCRDVKQLLAEIGSGGGDILVVSDHALSDGRDALVLAALDAREPDDVLPLVLLTASTDPAYPIVRRPDVLVVAKPTRRRIFESTVRAALGARRRVVELRSRRQKLETYNANLMRTRDELESRNSELASAMRAKDRFLANMSHELRTPLTAILGYADILKMGVGGDLSDRQRYHVERVSTSGRHLLDLITDILDFAKAGAGRLEVRSNPLDLAEVVRDAVDSLAPRAAEADLAIRTLPADPPLPTVLGDPARVRQVLLNLLSNAIKFTDRGEVTIGFSRPCDNEVSVVVRDTGIGIPPSKLAELFTEFYQADDNLTREREGTGLGLAISRQLALLMNGDLTAESEPGDGSTFTFTLPVSTDTSEKAAVREERHATA